MLSVTFYGPGGTAIGTVPSMDVPRVGEQVAFQEGVFTVQIVRYYIVPGPVVRVAVALNPITQESTTSQDFQGLSLEQLQREQLKGQPKPKKSKK